ncbi:MAG: hypothetical protein ACI9JN_001582 [Bacteroidia bacterium]|jgi:hypothetical protein
MFNPNCRIHLRPPSRSLSTFRHVLCILILCMSATVNAQINQTIRGQVFDKETKDRLAEVTITVYHDDGQIGALSDQTGKFVVQEVPVGRIGLVIQMVGYEDVVLSQIDLKSAKELVLEIGMQEAVAKFDEVVILGRKRKEVPNNEMATVSARSFTVEETSRHAAAAFDPARMAQNFAGVTTGGDDLYNEIVVRGNSPKGVLWRLEGVEIANPNHFAAGGG